MWDRGVRGRDGDDDCDDCDDCDGDGARRGFARIGSARFPVVGCEGWYGGCAY